MFCLTAHQLICYSELQHPCQFPEITVLFNELESGQPGLLVNKFLKRHISKRQLFTEAYHDTVQAFFGNGPARANPELTCHDDIVSIGCSAPCLITDLLGDEFYLVPGSFFTNLGMPLTAQFTDFKVCQHCIAVNVDLYQSYFIEQFVGNPSGNTDNDEIKD